MGNFLRTRFGQALTGMYVDRCDPNDILWAQLANANFFRALYSYAQPGWKDEVDLLTGKSWLKHASKSLKESKDTVPHWIHGGGQMLVSTAEILDRLAWLLMVITTFGDAALQWASASYLTEPCEAAPEYGWWKSNEPLGFWNNPVDWQDGPIWIVKEGNQGTVHTSGITIPAGQQGYIAIAANFTKFIGFGELVGYETRLIELPGKVLDHQQYDIPTSGPAMGPISFVWLPPTPQARIIEWQWRAHIEGGFTECQCSSGFAAAAWHKPGVKRKGLLVVKSPRAYNFTSVIDDQFK